MLFRSQKTVEQQLNWFRTHDASHPVFVGEFKNQVIAWASLSKWSDRCAYDSTAEVSIYVHKDFRNQGIGKQLMEIIVLEGKERGLHTLISRITSGNEKSIYLHERLGFEQIGVLKEVGKKFDKFHDVHMLQKVFKK